MTRRPCQCALAVFHKNVSNPTQNVEGVIKKDAATLQRPLEREDDLEWPPLIGLRHPASASCLGRHLRLAGRCPNNSSLFPPLAAVVVVALWPCSEEWIFLFVVPKRLRAFRNYFFTEGAIAGNGIYRKKPVNRFKVRTNSRHAKKGLLRGAAAPEGQVIAAQTSKLGSSFSMWILDIKALCSGSVNSASFTYLFSTAAVRTGSAMVPAPPMQPPGQPMPSSR